MIQQSAISDHSSILLVVGRQDTGDLEAQIRGSKHAWDIRIISSDALIKLVKIKENADEEETLAKVRSLLSPIEYTRVDNIIDVTFTATRDVEDALELNSPYPDSLSNVPDSQGSTKYSPVATIDLVRKRVIESLAQNQRISLIAHKRAQFWTPDHTIRVACAISKRYDKHHNYWYAYHSTWKEFLEAGEAGYFALGCVDKEVAFVLPRSVISDQLPHLGMTDRPDRSYWHIHLVEDASGAMSLALQGGPGQTLTGRIRSRVDLSSSCLGRSCTTHPPADFWKRGRNSRDGRGYLVHGAATICPVQSL